MASETYHFGQFVLDVTERRLQKSGEPIALEPKAFDVLIALVRRADKLVTKRELLDVVWPDTYVDEGILSVHVSALRKALEDHGVVETVPRSGYRFTRPVTRRSPHADTVSLQWPVGVLPSNPEVSELIGRGRQHLLSASRPQVPQAVSAFQHAIALDPGYASAHAGLALACCAQAELRLVDPDAAYAEARASALRALAMDDACADAQVALATVLYLSDWNWTGARRSLERALELDPDHTEALLLYGRLLETLGDLPGGLAAKQKALERNPSSAVVHLQIALSYWHQRRFDQVIGWAEKSLTLDPSHLLAHEFIAGAYLMKGDERRHMAESLRHAECYGIPSETLLELKTLYEAGGRRAIVEHTLQTAPPEAPGIQLALLNAEIGNMDAAFRSLDVAIARHDPSLVHIAVAPQWDRFRSDPRFEERLRRMGLALFVSQHGRGVDSHGPAGGQP